MQVIHLTDAPQRRLGESKHKDSDSSGFALFDDNDRKQTQMHRFQSLKSFGTGFPLAPPPHEIHINHAL